MASESVSAHFWNYSRSGASPVMNRSSTPAERISRLTVVVDDRRVGRKIVVKMP